MKDFKFFRKDVGCTDVSIGDGKIETFFLPTKKKIGIRRFTYPKVFVQTSIS